MLTILQAINLSTEFLGKKEIESPRINAELLLAHALNCKRLDLYLSYDRPMNDDEVNTYRELIKRRSKSEPLQYILGRVEFYGLDFKVDSSVLIPRQETEILVETTINFSNKENEIKILDIGAGSGNISISLAKHLLKSKITATDTDESSLETAESNAKYHNVSERIKFIKHDINSDEPIEEEFDIIVSNPPYISKEEFHNLRDELKVYEPKNALTDNSDGLSFYRGITNKANRFLKKGGRLFFEVGKGQAGEVCKILTENNFSEISIVKDYLKIDRVISGVRN
jgi:release factor glutamine methyltransferase